MKRFAALFAAVVMIFTIGACVNGQASNPDSDENTAVVQSV